MVKARSPAGRRGFFIGYCLILELAEPDLIINIVFHFNKGRTLILYRRMQREKALMETRERRLL